MIPRNGKNDMVDGYKVVTCSPVGRKRYVEIQVNFLLKLRHIIDKHVFWINTNDPDDLKYFDELIEKYPDFFEKLIVDLDDLPTKGMNVGKFYKYHTDPNTIYCKIDDDIVFMQLSKFEDFIRFRIKNPQYYLVYANIINSGLSFFLHNKCGAFTFNTCPKVEYSCTNDAWKNAQHAVFSFNEFFNRLTNDELYKFNFGTWILSDYERHSINFISWFGSEFAKIDHSYWEFDDETWLSQYRPAERFMPNCIYGGFLVVHYAFYTQREKLDANKSLLDKFKYLSEHIEMKNPA